jgi:hypothetical protein
VVEGRAAASLARVFRIVFCFTYNNETQKELSCQAPNEHDGVKSNRRPGGFALLFGRSDPETTPKSRRLEGVAFTRNKLKPSASASTCQPDATGACKHNKLNGLCISRQKLARADLKGTQTFNRAPAMRCSASARAALLATSRRSETRDYYHGLLAEEDKPAATINQASGTLA